MSDLVGTEVGRYRITRVLGAGGMGTVYEGVQAESGASVAIKVLSERYARDRELIDRFFSEARATNVIAHENIVKVHDLSQLPDGRPYIVMELLAGKTLRALIDSREPLPIGGVLDAAIAVLGALSAAHAAGIVHRDIKPDNIFITAKGRAKVLDFGIAKLTGAHALARTETGVLLGTPEYMAPEQITDGRIDARSDLYSLGIVLFEALTGRRPFQASSDFELMRAHVEGSAPPASSLRRELPPHTDDVIGAAMAKDPRERFDSAVAMGNALRHLATGVAIEQWRSLVPSGRLARPRPPTSPQLVLPSRVRITERPTVAERPSARKQPRRGRGVVWAILGIALAGVAGAVVAMQLREPAAATPAPVVTIVESPPPPPPPIVIAEPPKTPTIDEKPPLPKHTSPRRPTIATSAPPDAAPIDAPAIETIGRERTITGYAQGDFDWRRFLPTANALARAEAADAEWTGVSFGYVTISGAVSTHEGITYDYRSKQAAKTACGIHVTVVTDTVEVTRNASCRGAATALPRCSLKDVRARTLGAMPKTDTHPSHVMFSGTSWTLHQGLEDVTIEDACDAPLRTITRKLWTIESGASNLATLGTNALVLSRMIAADTQLARIEAQVDEGPLVPFASVEFTYGSRALARESACVRVRVFGNTMSAFRTSSCARSRASIALPKCTLYRATLLKVFDRGDVVRVTLDWDGAAYTIRVLRKGAEEETLTEADKC